MALTQQQVLQIKQKGKAKGYSDQQINTALIELDKQFAGGGAPPQGGAPASQSSAFTPQKTQQIPEVSAPKSVASKATAGSLSPAPEESGGIVSNFFKGLYNTGANYTKFVGEAAAQGVRAVIDPIGDASSIDTDSVELGKQSRELIAQAKRTKNPTEKKRLLQQSRDIDAQIEGLGARAQKIGEKKTSFFVDEEKIKDRKSIALTGAKATAGAASLVVPGGATLKTAVGLGIASGALYGFAEGEDIDVNRILTSAVTSGLTAGLFKGGEKVASKVAGKVASKVASKASGKLSIFQKSKNAIKESLEETAEKSINKASPSVWRKGVEEKGIDINHLTKKYFKKAGATSKKGIGYDDLLGPIGKRGRGGSLQKEILANEGVIKKALSATSKNTKISMDDFVGALNKEMKTLKLLPGNEGNMKALQAFIDTTKKQYGKGMTPKTMLALKRAADSKFGRAVTDETTGSATAQAQKMFANSARSTLKKLFPEIKDALDNESEVYVIRPVLNHARSVLKTQGSGIRVGSLRGRSMSDLINPLSYIEALMANPKNASRFLGGEAEQAAAKGFLQNIPDASGVISKLGPGAQVAGRDAALLSQQTPGSVPGAAPGQPQIQPVEADQAGQPGAIDDGVGDDIQSQADHASILQEQQQAAKPFGGRSKNDLLQMAIAQGATFKDLKEIGDIYDMIAPEGAAGDVDDLLKKRKNLADGGFDTSSVDAQLAGLGIGKVEKGTQDLITQINELGAVDARNARATKDILDVVDVAIKTADEGAPTGPLSAIGAFFSKQYNPNETAQLEKDLSEIMRTIRKESTGVAYSPQEISDLEKEIPTIAQQEGNVKDSLARLRRRMLQKLTNFGLDVEVGTE